MKEQVYKQFSPEEHRTWGTLFRNLDHCRKEQADTTFSRGVELLGLNASGVPSIKDVNAKLERITGWNGVPVEGLEENGSFFEAMANKKFPIGNFIRDARDVNYTPAPDVFHDLYGHLPFFTDPDYAKFCEEFGRRAAKVKDNPKGMDLWGRLFWFGVEFPLIETPKGHRIFGGGILSSFGESNYCLSDKPEVRPFNIAEIVDRTYKIDEFQRTIFLLGNKLELYDCLPAYEKLVLARL
jgi:phenylalanine-4-hydroxylase